MTSLPSSAARLQGEGSYKAKIAVLQEDEDESIWGWLWQLERSMASRNSSCATYSIHRFSNRFYNVGHSFPRISAGFRALSSMPL